LVGGARFVGGTVSTVGRGVGALFTTPAAIEQIVAGQDIETVKAGVNGAVDSLKDQTEAAAILFPGVTVGTLTKHSVSAAFKRGIGRVARVPGGRPCRYLLAGTLVETAEGMRPIQDIEVGDMVRARDPATGKFEFVEVSATWRRDAESYVRIWLEDEKGAPRGKLEITEDHPIWVEGEGWEVAQNLRVGEELGGRQPFVIARIDTVAGSAAIHDLTVPVAASFVAGDNGILVHSCHHTAKLAVSNSIARPLNLDDVSKLLNRKVASWKEVRVGELREARDRRDITQGQFSKTLRGDTSTPKKALVDKMEETVGYASVRFGDWFFPVPARFVQDRAKDPRRTPRLSPCRTHRIRCRQHDGIRFPQDVLGRSVSRTPGEQYVDRRQHKRCR
jgi:hypothetical protein